MAVIEKNYKILNIDEVVHLILDFKTVDRITLQQLSSNRLDYLLDKMVENEELFSTKIANSLSTHSIPAYYFEEFSKKGQLKAYYSSFFTNFLSKNDFKYGDLYVDKATNNLKVPIILDGTDDFLIVNTEVYPVSNGELSTFVEIDAKNAIPVYVVNSLINYGELLPKVKKNSIIFVKDSMMAFSISLIEGKLINHKLQKEDLKTLNRKGLTRINNIENKNALLEPYVEAEKRSNQRKNKAKG